MRIASGTTDQYIYFVAVDSSDFTTRETGLSGFTVYRSRNGDAAAAMTTPTINETDATNMPGVYELLLDEDMTIDSGDETQEIVFHISAAGMAPVTRTIELFRPKITVGNTLGVAADGDISGNVDGSVASVAGSVGSVTGNVGGSVASVTGSVGSVTGNVGGNVTGSIGSLATTAKNDVNAEVVDALATDTYAEPSQGAPGATVSLASKISRMYAALINKCEQTTSERRFYDNAGTTVLWKQTTQDASSVASYTSGVTGP